MKCFLHLVLLTFLIGFSQSGAEDSPKAINLVAENANEPLEKSTPVKNTPVFVGESQTAFMIQVNGEIKTHYHAEHEETVIIIEGNGAFVVEGKEIPAAPGSCISFPKGTRHSFRSAADKTVVALSVFSPAFDGKDRIFVE